MAKVQASHGAAKEPTVRYPSPYGSHRSMIDEAATKELTDKSKVACKDEHGIYITERFRLDNGEGDPNRYAEARLKFD